MSVFREPMMRARLALHVLTDRKWSRGRTFLQVAEAAITGGASVIQLRDKEASTRTLIEEGLALRRLTRQRGVLLIINDRIDVALALDADGAHIGQDDMPGELARKLLGPGRVLGISAGNLEEAETALKAGADYLGVGPIYATGSKADAGLPVGTGLITELTRCYSLPLIGIGGIRADNAGAVIMAGATGVAVISAIVGAEDIEQATRAVAQALRR